VKQNFEQGTKKYSGPIRYKDFYSTYIDRIMTLGIQSVTELGTASGDFLYHLPDSVVGIGIDKSAELIEVAKATRQKPNLTFQCADILEDQVFTETDLVVMTGFLCTFMDFKPVFEAALSISNKYIFVNDFLNSFGIDSRFAFREGCDQDFQNTYNIWAVGTIESYLSSLGLQFSIEPYLMASHLDEAEDPMFNFHAELDGKRVLTNRGGILLDGYNIFITKPNSS